MFLTTGEAMEETARGSPGSVAWCIAGNVLFGAGLFFHSFLYNFYLEALGHSEAVMGYAAAALTGGGLAMLLPAGRLVDRVGPRVAMVAAGIVAGLGLALGAWMGAVMPILAAALMAGAGGGLWRVAVGPALMQLTSSGRRARVFAWNVGLILLSGAGGIALAGAVPRWFAVALGVSRLSGLRLALFSGALLTALSVAAFALLRLQGTPPTPVSDQPGVGSPPEDVAAAAAPFLPLVGLVAVWMLGAALLAPFLNIYFARRFTLSIGSVGLMFGAAHLLWALAVFGSGELALRWGVRALLPAVALLFAPAAWGLALARGVTVALPLYFLQGAVGPVTNPLIDQVLLAQVPRRQQGRVSGWRNMAADVSGIVGASAGGMLLSAGGFQGLFAVAGLLGLIGGVGLLGWVRER